MEKLYTTEELAEHLGLATGTLENWRYAKEGRPVIPYIKVGWSVRYRASDVEAYIASQNPEKT